MQVIKQGDRWIARSSYEERALPKAAGFWWDPASKVWWTRDQEKVSRLQTIGSVEQAQGVLAEKEQVKQHAISASKATDARIEVPVPDGLEYMPFQKAGIAYCQDKTGVLIADEMGLGKTIQAIGVVNADPKIEKVLVICPASLRINWARELAKWLVRPMTVGIASGDVWPETQIVVINYDILTRHAPAISQVPWDLLIVDECHYLKNPKARRTQMVLGHYDRKKKEWAVQPLVAKRRLFMTGTPIVNRPVELWPLVNSLRPDVFRNFFGFAKRYCDAHDNGYGWDFTGASNLPELQEKLRSTCFYYNTVVETEKGPIAIGDIVEHGYRYKVLSIDVETAKISWRPIIAVTKRIAPCQMVRVQHEKGEFTCTPDHRIWTDHGWVRANSLVSDMHLSVVQKIISCETRQLQILFDQACGEAPRIAGHLTYEGQCQALPEPAVFTEGGLSAVWERNNRQEEILWLPMCRQMELHTHALFSWYQGDLAQTKECDSEMAEVCKTTGLAFAWFQTQRCIKSEAIGGSPEILGCAQGKRLLSDVSNACYSSTATQTTQPRSSCFGEGVEDRKWCDRGPNTDQREVCFCRYCIGQSYYRGGWGYTRSEKTASARPVPGYCFAQSRILCVEVVELGNRGRPSEGIADHRFVYDIEVDSTHTFFADGALVHNCMVRRLKKDVLTELPAKRRQIIELPQNGATSMIAAENDAWLRHEDILGELQAAVSLADASDDPTAYAEAASRLGKARKVAFEDISRFRHVTAVAKCDQVIDHVRETLESVDKIVVFAHHHDVVERIMSGLSDYNPVQLTGETKMEDRQKAVDSFQNDINVRVFVGSITAAGVGLTLTSASHVVFAELDWVPGRVSQAEDRCHRIGQSNQVLVQHLVFEKSLDARMVHTLVGKESVIAEALDNPLQVAEAVEVAKTLPAKPQPNLLPDQIAAAHEAVRRLAAACDGAQSLDGHGFNKCDTMIGHSLAACPNLTPRQAALAIRVCRKYKRQLGADLIARFG